MKTFEKDIEKAAIDLLQNKNLFKDNYRMKCLKWYQRVRIFFDSWYATFQSLPIILKYIKQAMKEQKHG